MLLSLALIFLVGLSLTEIMQAIRMPRIVGMLLAGVVMEPFGFD